MKRRSLPVAAAFAATAALLLTACGSGDDKSSDNDKIAGADTGDSTESASPSASTDSGQRPKVTLPSDVTNVFDSWKTGDTTKDAVLADVSGRINATDAAIASGDSESSAIPFYYKGDALLGAADWIASFKKEGLTINGKTRYFEPTITMFDKTSASVRYCSDESKAYNKNRKTGKIDKTPATDNSYVLYNTRVDKNKQGVWQTTQLVSKRGVEPCTP
ncbi:hypothetical protein [Streptomyces sp. R35]|uniref:Lipoprotein n=1 Tax=Streptomyces sp. R35 TaxID=3238630 RepID=A0AB39SBT2_9ACTN